MSERKVQTMQERAEWRASKIAKVEERHAKRAAEVEALRKPHDLPAKL